jgi:predicted DNA-binding transcriptional regulator AlpA
MTAKALHSAKIKELGETLAATGYLQLDEQASVLGLPRSTTWTIVRAKHKNTGLSASVIKRMLGQPRLPAPVRTKIREYVDEKSAGIYGHNSEQVRRFVGSLQNAEHPANGSRRFSKEPTRPPPASIGSGKPPRRGTHATGDLAPSNLRSAGEPA